MKRSIAIIGTRGYPSYYGGFETAVRQLAPHLADNGWDVTVYGRPGATRANDPAADPRVRTVTTHGLNSKAASTLSFGLTSAIHAARRKPAVALVMNCANGFWLPLLKLRGIRTAVNVDGIEWEREKWGRVARFIFRLGARFVARFADVIICDSVEIARYWKREFGRDSETIAYGGHAPAESESPLGLPARGYALVVARFVPENTINEFFDAVPALSKHLPVVIVGSSGFDDEFDARAKELSLLDNVHALGHVSDDALLFSLWSHAGAYFHGHSVGGTNPALVQAMACGAPTVARDTVFNREVLGDAAVFVSPSPEAIIGGILAVTEDAAHAEALGSAAQKRASEHYTWEKISAQYEGVAGELLGQR